MMRKEKGLRSTNWLLQNSHGGVKYSIGNIVNNIPITIYMVSDGYKIYWDNHLVDYIMLNHWDVPLKLI